LDSRKNKRLILPENADAVIPGVYLEFDLDNSETVKAGIFDISIGGIAVVVNGLDESLMGKIEKLDDFFIRLHIKNNMFLIGVEPVWKIYKKQERDFIFKGGYKFDLMSEKDRLELSELIEELRSSDFMV
jgi:c-di-GMP-binding flagellar brake protein YcgR